jgi:5'-3' exonuclease
MKIKKQKSININIMGIKNLNKLIKKICPDIFKYIHISGFSYKKIAIDTSLYMHKFKSVCGDKWIVSFINLIIVLRKNNVHCVFIFDGKPPPQKEKEKEKRKEAKIKLEENLYILEQSLEKYYKTGILDKNLLDLYKKNNNHVSLLTNNINIKIIEDKIKQKRNQIININSEDFTLIKELLDILKIPYYTSPGEAEKMCAKLCIDGIIDGVLSEDTDLLAYKCPVFLSKIDMYREVFVQINYKELLDNLQLNSDEFLDVCIMCGNDYNTNIPKIGSIKSYDKIQKYKNIETFEHETKINTDNLNYLECREMFNYFVNYNIAEIPFCGIPEYKEFKNFIVKNNIVIDTDNIYKKFLNNDINFE